MSSIYTKKGWLYASVPRSKQDGGTGGKTKFKCVALKIRDTPAGRVKARSLLEKAVERRKAHARVGRGAPGLVTMKQWADQWLEKRKKLGVVSARLDKSRLNLHVLPIRLSEGKAIRDMPLTEVRARHLVELFDMIRTGEITTQSTGKARRGQKFAPRSIRNLYSTLSALFRDAVIEDLIEASPCVLTKHHLGVIMDKDSEWRAGARYTRAELEMLISDERIPPDRRVFYALEGIGANRHGEAAGLRWRHYDSDLAPLGRFTVATSYNKGRTKTGRTRFMPVHHTLAAMLAEWRLTAWPAIFGRTPTPDDLICPFPPCSRSPQGRMRYLSRSQEFFVEDLKTLGLRHRRGHDLRRTMISLSLEDGARKDLLKYCTHGPPQGEGIDAYITIGWEPLCTEIAKLKVKRTPRGRVVALRAVAVASGAPDEDPADEQLARKAATKTPTIPPGIPTRFLPCEGKPGDSQVILGSGRRIRTLTSGLQRPASYH